MPSSEGKALDLSIFDLDYSDPEILAGARNGKFGGGADAGKAFCAALVAHAGFKVDKVNMLTSAKRVGDTVIPWLASSVVSPHGGHVRVWVSDGTTQIENVPLASFTGDTDPAKYGLVELSRSP